MILSYGLNQRGNLYPEAYNCLRSLPDITLQHTDHGLRHPLAIYNISLHRVIHAFQEVLNENEKVYHAPLDEQGNANFNTDPLLKAQQELLDALMAHIDDGYQILKALYPVSQLPTPRNAKQVMFADQLLEQAKHPTVMHFKHLIKPYRNSFAPIVNKIKHEHGRLRAILMRNYEQPYNSQQRILGYFLEGIDKQGAVGPDMKIHGGNRAFSLYRDLRYHFVHLYMVDHFLSDAIVNAINTTYAIHFTPLTHFDAPSPGIIAVAEGIFRLPFLFFFDEVGKPTPTVRLSTNPLELVLNDTSQIRAVSLRKWNARVQYSGDEVTKTWKFPYMAG